MEESAFRNLYPQPSPVEPRVSARPGSVKRAAFISLILLSLIGVSSAAFLTLAPNGELSFWVVQWGIFPRARQGLLGLLTAPFVHGSWLHLTSNLIALAPLIFLILLTLPKVGFRVLGLTYLTGHYSIWVFGRASWHIGASVWAYALLGFLLVGGFLRRDRASLALSFIVLFTNLGFGAGFAPDVPHISWDGHLAGFLVGIAWAIYFRKADRPQDPSLMRLEASEQDTLPEEVWDYKQQLPPGWK